MGLREKKRKERWYLDLGKIRRGDTDGSDMVVLWRWIGGGGSGSGGGGGGRRGGRRRETKFQVEVGEVLHWRGGEMAVKKKRLNVKHKFNIYVWVCGYIRKSKGVFIWWQLRGGNLAKWIFLFSWIIKFTRNTVHGTQFSSSSRAI